MWPSRDCISKGLTNNIAIFYAEKKKIWKGFYVVKEPEGENEGKTFLDYNGLLGLIPDHMSQCMRFPTMWYVGPAKPQISLRICTVWSEPLLVSWVFNDW